VTLTTTTRKRNRRRARFGRLLFPLLLALICGCVSPKILDLERYRGEGFRDGLAKESQGMRTQDIDSDGPTTFSARARQIEKNLGY
jgi:hypothetical protein